VQIRQNRLLGLHAEHDADQYVDRQAVAGEIGLRASSAPSIAGPSSTDAPLDRRNRGRNHSAAGRSSPPAGATVKVLK